MLYYTIDPFCSSYKIHKYTTTRDDILYDRIEDVFYVEDLDEDSFGSSITIRTDLYTSKKDAWKVIIKKLEDRVNDATKALQDAITKSKEDTND
jgi:hypothetical protein